MNNYTYDEIEAGMTAEFSREVTAEMMEQFKAISGDINPLHNDEDFAKNSNFPGRVVYGMLTASLYSTLAGVYLPGEKCLLHSVHSDFLNPAFIGDVLTVSGKVKEKNDSVHQVIIKAVIRNQNGKKISRATIEAGVL